MEKHILPWWAIVLAAGILLAAGSAMAQLPGGSVDPADIPQFVTPLVIPPVMEVEDPAACEEGAPEDAVCNDYQIALREFRQQILPGGIWNAINGRSDKYEPTKVWSYGPADDEAPRVAPDPGTQFNYPAYTVETLADVPVDVRWTNDLVDESGNFLPHLIPIDQTLHWANPPQECRDGTTRTDCAGVSEEHYEGPVPMVVHVHGAHVDPNSDGYPEAWWLPAANNIPAGYATKGRLFDDKTGANPGNLGYADYYYRQDQPATTLWYHDHSLGITRNNVYAGPAGFWLIRGGENDWVNDTSVGTEPPVAVADWDGVLPGPAPAAGDTLLELNAPGLVEGTIDKRRGIREIPVVIQDRSFDKNGRFLFYPKRRAFFEDVDIEDLKIDFATEDDSDVAPSWQPEAFFNVMVVNGVSWPALEVAPALYRLRLLNGCDSRFLWLKFEDDDVEVWQIGAEQGFLPAPLYLNDLDLDESADGTAQVLLGPAERADVLVDFRGIADGTEIVLINLGPDEPFGGGIPGDDFDPAHADTTGKVLRFVVNATVASSGGPLGASPTDPVLADGITPNPNAATDPADLGLNVEGALGAANGVSPRNISLNEEESARVCVLFDPVADAYIQPIKEVDCATPSPTPEGYEVVAFGPTAALLGQVDLSGAEPEGIPLQWTEEEIGVLRTITVPGGEVEVWVTEDPDAGDTEEWDIYNFTEDAHPIHLHLVRFEVIGRQAMDGGDSIVGNAPQPWESGYKDTVIAYPGEITTVKAEFDIPGLYVWHCHILEHEDNEMMRPYHVDAD